MKLLFPNSHSPDGFNDESGAILPLFAIILLVLLAFAAFAIDFGFAYMRQAQLQSVADAEALACSRTYNTCTSGGDAFPLTNPYRFTIVLTNPVSCPNPSIQNSCVQAVASITQPTFFLPLFGIKTLTLSKTAIAGKRATADVMVIRGNFSANGNNIMTVSGGSVAIGGNLNTTNKSGINATATGAKITVYNNGANSCGSCTPTAVSSGSAFPTLLPYAIPSAPTVQVAPICVGNVGTFQPGSYAASVTMSCATNNLQPGIYKFNGGLNTNSKTVNGSGVTLIIGVDQPLTLSGTVTLNSSSGGSTCGTAGGGMLVYQAPTLTNTYRSWSVAGSGNNVSLTGQVQLPNTNVSFSGTPTSLSITGSMYLNSLSFNGNMSAQASADPCQNINLGSGSNILVQ